MHGSKYANWALNKADLVIAVGSRFDDRVTGKVSAFAPGAKVIHFDIDAAEVGKIRHAEIPVVGPLEARARAARRARSEPSAADGLRPRAVAAPARGLARAVPVPLREAGRRPEAADRDRGAARPRGGARRGRRSGRPASASTRCGRCSTSSVRQAALVHHLGRARDDGLRPARPRSARRPRARTRPSSASTATAASR